MLSQTILNVVVDAVLRHWATMSLAEAERRGERGSEGRHQAALFYANDGMVVLSDPHWIQWAFDALVSLFEQVGLQNNVGKTVSMDCRPCQVAGTQSVAVYWRRMTGEGPTYRERQKERVECRECGNEMAAVIVGIPQDDTAWEGNIGAMNLGILGHGRQPADVLAGLTDQGRATELPCRGLTRTSRDADSDADAFMQPECPGYRDNIGGRKTPTPKVLTMQHAGPIEGTKR